MQLLFYFNKKVSAFTIFNHRVSQRDAQRLFENGRIQNTV